MTWEEAAEAVNVLGAMLGNTLCPEDQLKFWVRVECDACSGQWDARNAILDAQDEKKINEKAEIVRPKPEAPQPVVFDKSEGPLQYRPHSTYQCGEEIVGGWADSLQKAKEKAISWRGLPVGAGYGFWIESNNGKVFRCCPCCSGIGEVEAKDSNHKDCCPRCAASGLVEGES